MLTTAAVLALWIDVDSVARDECDRWYVDQHIAERMRVPGWQRARRFRALGPTHPETLALYDVDTAEQLVSDAYLSLQRNVSALDKRMRAAFRNVVRGTFHVAHSAGQGEGGVLLSLRFRPDAQRISQDAARCWIVDKLTPQLLAVVGVVAVRLLISAPELRARHDAHRKSGSSDAEAHWVLLVEATEEDRADDARAVLAGAGEPEGLGLVEGVFGIYGLMYAASHATHSQHVAPTHV